MRSMNLRIQQFTVIAGAVLASAAMAPAQQSSLFFQPGNLVVSRTVYDNNPVSYTHLTLPTILLV